MHLSQVLLLAAVCAHFCARFVNAQVFNPMHYNARGDGKTDDTKAVRATLAAAAANKGGEVLFDKQYTFLTGCFNVTSNVILNVKGTILASLNSDDYVQVSSKINMVFREQ
jgi:polygalacturonase